MVATGARGGGGVLAWQPDAASTKEIATTFIMGTRMTDRYCEERATARAGETTEQGGANRASFTR